MRNRNRPVQPDASHKLDNLKYEVSRNLGILPAQSRQVSPAQWDQTMDSLKDRVVGEMGIRNEVLSRGWGDMPSRECGAVGGRMGGRIGGQMVREMIRRAEDSLATRHF